MNDNYSNLCRFCLDFVEIPKRIEITEIIREKFKLVVDIELKFNKFYPEFYCSRCSHELQVCLDVREKFKRNQQVLEGYFKSENDDVNTDIFDFVNIKTESVDENEISLEPEINIETRNSESDEDSEEEDAENDSDSSEKVREPRKRGQPFSSDKGKCEILEIFHKLNKN